METPGLLVAFLAGMALFLSPCVAPLIPAYLANISGVRLSEMARETQRRSLQIAILKNAIAFILGFSLMFVVVGTFVGYLSSLVLDYQTWLNRVGGALIMLLALHLLGLLKIPFLERGLAVGVPAGSSSGALRSALMGLSFGVSFSPCTGPVLGAILAYTATSGSTASGALLMTSFSAGLAVPFLLTGFFTMSAVRWLSAAPRWLMGFQLVAGVMLLALGVVVFTGRLPGLIGLFYSWF